MDIAAAASVIILYPLVLLGDGCLLIAIAVASTTRGHSLLWGASFALFHALYGVLGVLLASQLLVYSGILGELFMLAGAVFLLWHFAHHRLHHRMHHDCSCENHPSAQLSALGVISSAAALSLHALAGGAIVQSIMPEASTASTVSLLIAASVVLGLLSFAILKIGELEQQHILKLLDRLPGIVGFILTALCFGVLYHIIDDALASSPLLLSGFILVAAVASACVGRLLHGRRAPPVVKIGAKK